jgi:hypothetical protein
MVPQLGVPCAPVPSAAIAAITCGPTSGLDWDLTSTAGEKASSITTRAFTLLFKTIIP